MCIYIYMYMYVCMYVYIYIYIYIYMHTVSSEIAPPGGPTSAFYN